MARWTLRQRQFWAMYVQRRQKALLAVAKDTVTAAFNFLTSSSLTSSQGQTFQHSRGTNATYYRSVDGRLTFANANMANRSEEFDNAYWTKTGSTIVPNALLAPDGTLSMCKFAESSISGLHRAYIVAGNAEQVQTFSVYAKAAERTWMRIDMGSASAFFDLVNGVVGNVAGGATASIAAVPDNPGVWRCSVYGTPVTNTNCLLYIATGNNTSSYQGVTGNGIYIWGAQIQPGPLQAYVKTTGTPYYAPRFDTDPATLQPRGLLIEEQRTNLFLFSNEFSNAVWIKSDTTVTANSAVSPDGLTNSDLVAEGVTLTNTSIRQTSQAYAANTVVTMTVFLKKGAVGDIVRIKISDSATNTDGGQAWFNVNTGVVGTINTFGAGSGFSATIKALPNGWYRCSISGLTNATSTTARVQISSAATDGLVATLANAARYQYGAQIEAFAFSSSYIPSYSAAATRAADIVNISAGSWYNQSEGTFIVQAVNVNPALTQQGVMSANNGSDQNRIDIRTEVRALISSGGVNTSILSGAGVGINVLGKYAHSYKVGSSAIVVNGTIIGTGTPAAVPSNVNNIQLGNIDGNLSNPFTGYIQSFSYYNRQLSNADLQAKTA